MSLFGLSKGKSMLEEVKECLDSPDGVLLDVRSPEEYSNGHIPGSINIPVNSIHEAGEIIKGKDAPVCVYCLSGIRAASAAAVLRGEGYTKVKNLGGIKKYHGRIER
ncbi:MAG: rhodanese-like domain-containing protein [Bacillota bacterium]|nr:rhodanese-like domain-containing protein [Bacillota bacterium]